MCIYIDSGDYSDKQRKQILGTSIGMLERHCIDNKLDDTDVDLFENPKKKKEYRKKKEMIHLKL